MFCYFQIRKNGEHTICYDEQENNHEDNSFRSAQKCSDEDLILLLADKRKMFRDFRSESHIPVNIISEDIKKRKRVVALK